MVEFCDVKQNCACCGVQYANTAVQGFSVAQLHYSCCLGLFTCQAVLTCH